jgi:hypothetical protein
MKHDLDELPRIGHSGDAIALLDEMIGQCKETNAEGLPGFRGMDKAIGSTGYFWPRLAALRDAIGRGIVWTRGETTMKTTFSKDVLFLTMAVIRQGKRDSRRLEAAIMGHGKDSRAWLINQRSFYGPTSDHLRGAWQKLHEWALDTELTFTRADGVRLKVEIAGIQEIDHSAEFCETWANTYVLHPAGYIHDPKSETGFSKYRHEGTAYTVAVEYYESTAKKRMEISGDSESLLRQTAYNLCLADIWLHAKVNQFKEHATSRVVLEILEKELSKPKPPVTPPIREPAKNADNQHKISVRARVPVFTGIELEEYHRQTRQSSTYPEFLGRLIGIGFEAYKQGSRFT